MCGIFAVFGSDNASYDIKMGLEALQHRGQNGAGIYTYGDKSDAFYKIKGPGLIRDVFHSKTLLDNLEGNYGIGHVRYPTIGSSKSRDEESYSAQPFRPRMRPALILAHNGNLLNSVNLAEKLNKKYNRRVVKSDCDGEVLAAMLADSFSKDIDRYDAQYVFEAVENVMDCVTGSYSAVSIIKNVGMVAFRDPKGIRPLVMGHRREDNSYAFASEVVAFRSTGYEPINSLGGGEAVFLYFSGGEPVHRRLVVGPEQPCFFEAVYFSDVVSESMGLPVYDIRVKHGKLLADTLRNKNLDLQNIDFVAPIPDGGNALATGLADALGKPRKDALRKSKYIGRTFIANTQSERQRMIQSKFDTIDSVIRGARFVLVDDSIVRGNTTKKLLNMLRGAGAEEVHVVIGNAPTIHVCQLGIDMPEPDELIASSFDTESLDELIEGIRNEIGATTLTYLTPKQVAEGFNRSTDEMCMGCISGEYPISPEKSFTKKRNTERLNTKEY